MDILIECDDNYNITHYKDNQGLEYWKRYINDRLVYYADSNGYLYTNEYIGLYIRTTYTFPDGKEIQCIYNTKDNTISL